MISQNIRKIEVATIVFVLLMSAVTPVSASLLAGSSVDGTPQEISNDMLIEASGDVDVWKKSVLPLRAQYDNAATSITGPSIDGELEDANTGEVSLNKKQMGVFNAGDTIEFNYLERTGAGTGDFANTDTKLLVAKKSSDSTTGMGLPDMDTTDLSDIVTEDANGEYDFMLKEDAVSLNEDGEAEGFDYTPSESGQYAFFLVENTEGGDGISVDNGELTVNDQVRVIGMDAALVQEGLSDVEVEDDDEEPGDSFTFNVDAQLEDADDVTHTIMLYDEEKMQEQRFLITVTGEMDEDISADQVTVSHTVETVNGVANIPDGVTDESEFDDGEFTGSAQMGNVVQFLAEESERGEPNTDATGDNRLDASLTTVEDDQTVEITVETLNNWNEDDYRWVHYAVGEDTDEISTSTGTVEVDERRNTGGGGGAPPSGGDDDDDDEDDNGSDDSDDNADDGSDNADDGSDNSDDNADDGSDNADDGSDNSDDNSDNTDDSESDDSDSDDSGSDNSDDSDNTDDSENTDDTTSPDNTTSTTFPGFGPIPAVVALVLSALGVAYTRRD